MTTRPEPQLPTRYDVEWATERSPLPTVARDVLYALSRRMQQGSTVIPLQYAAISLSALAAAAGWSKRHVQRALTYLEDRDVISRRRPTKHDARVNHARTAYTVHYDALIKLGTGSPKKAGDTVTYGLGPVRRKPRDRQSRGLETGSPAARDTVAHNQNLPEQPEQTDREIGLIVGLLKVRTGVTVTHEQAAETRRVLLARPGASDQPPMAYIRRILTQDKQPKRWLPPREPDHQEEAS